MADAPSVHAIFAIVLALGAIVLYTRERIPLEASSLAILCIVLVWCERSDIRFDDVRIRADDILAGFGNEALIAITALMVLARGLETTRALQPIGRALAEAWRVRPQVAFLMTLLTVATLSMFLNNTPVVAAILPLLITVSLQARTPASGILMPVGFATIVGGMATTIGTSTNLIVTSIAADLGIPEFGMFDFARPVLVVGACAIAFLWLVAPRLLPLRSAPLTDVRPRVFESRLRINDGGPADGLTLAEALALTKNRMRVNRVERGGLHVVKLPSVQLRDGDMLHVDDTPENLKEFERILGATLLASDANFPVDLDHPLQTDRQLAEVVVTPGSALEHRAIDAVNVLAERGIVPLALHRPGRPAVGPTEAIGRAILHAGDVILLQGPAPLIDRLKRRGQLLVLDGKIDLPKTGRASVALAITACVIVVAAAGLARIALAAVVGVGLMLATRCLTWRELKSAIDTRIILVIVSSLALGTMLMATGAAAFIATAYVGLTGALPVPVILSGLILIMAMLTEVATNNAIAVLGTPIAVGVANQLGAPAEPFVLAVLFGANMSYLTPVGYQTNLLVMSAGGYRFSDFLRVGIPLQIIMWLGISIALPIFHPL